LNAVCPGCHGTGKVLIDCPYCRNTEQFEHEELTSGVCHCCNNNGHLEDVCPICNGTGKKLEKDHVLKV
jgi:RecJ-like exonuclease